MNAASLAGIRWRRGAIRLWIVTSALWCVISMSIAATSMHAAWLWAPSKTIHVKISDTETWDYPVEWGEARITDDLTKRLADLDRQDRDWASNVSAARKAECDAIPSKTPFTEQPKDCVRLFFYDDWQRAVPNDWRIQLQDKPDPIWPAAGRIVPLVVGPPLLLLVLGFAFSWVLSGFRRA
jgi:hypothetical protein